MHHSDLEAEGFEDPAKEALRRSRSERAQLMFGLIKPKPLADLSNHHIGPATSAQELSDIRLSNKSACWTVVRVDNKIDSQFGISSYSVDPDETLPEVLNRILEHVNLKWTCLDGNYLSLTSKFCELGFKNNFRISPEAVTLTVKGLYQFYAARSDRVLALGKDNAKHTKGLAKGTYLEMELLVSKVEYLKNVQRLTDLDIEEDSDTEASSSGKRRKKSQELPLSKRSKTQEQLHTRSYLLCAPTDFLKFTTIDCNIDAETGIATLDETRTVKTGKMEKGSLSGIRQADIGKSKDVFKLTINGLPGTYAAKSFFDVGQGRGKGLEANEVLLLHDLVRLKRLGLFRDQFMQAARDTCAEVSNFNVSDAFAIVVRSQSGQDVNLAYLVEPLRSTTVVEKFSGTIGGSDNSPNQLSSTMSAFTHYILEKTACRFAITDLQGEYSVFRVNLGFILHLVGSLHCARAGTSQEWILFDPMSHSLSGNTGVGDHGPTGIDDTIRTHKCSFVCRSMKLSNMASLKATFAAEKDKLDDMEVTSDDGKDALDGFVLRRAAASADGLGSEEVEGAPDIVNGDSGA
ncbi:hypothetical protein B0H12DRAFT_1239951 [Mycena haematopus]|nr:hypothetical protein B0H12DRAFT_1239951 [Mycena haematopus]